MSPTRRIRVESVNRSRAVEVLVGGRGVLTAIGKQPVRAADQPVAVGRLGLDGDEQADPSVHGGPGKALYAYPREHYAFWQTVRAQARVAPWGEALAPGALGENLTLSGVLEGELWVGDRLRLPRCVLAVSAPRLPCAKFAAAMGFAQAPRLMIQSGYCGSCLAVIEPGAVAAGDEAELIAGPREVGLAELFRARARG